MHISQKGDSVQRVQDNFISSNNSYIGFISRKLSKDNLKCLRSILKTLNSDR